MWGRREECVLWPEVNLQFISTCLFDRKNFTCSVTKRKVRMQHTQVSYMSVQDEVSCTSFSRYAEVVRPYEKSRLQRGAKKICNSKRGHKDINADKCLFYNRVSVALQEWDRSKEKTEKSGTLHWAVHNTYLYNNQLKNNIIIRVGLHV
jgi:hypothetical protein